MSLSTFRSLRASDSIGSDHDTFVLYWLVAPSIGSTATTCTKSHGIMRSGASPFASSDPLIGRTIYILCRASAASSGCRTSYDCPFVRWTREARNGSFLRISRISACRNWSPFHAESCELAAIFKIRPTSEFMASGLPSQWESVCPIGGRDTGASENSTGTHEACPCRV